VRIRRGCATVCGICLTANSGAPVLHTIGDDAGRAAIREPGDLPGMVVLYSVPNRKVPPWRRPVLGGRHDANGFAESPLAVVEPGVF
jgi:hypothetical protein